MDKTQTTTAPIKPPTEPENTAELIDSRTPAGFPVNNSKTYEDIQETLIQEKLGDQDRLWARIKRIRSEPDKASS